MPWHMVMGMRMLLISWIEVGFQFTGQIDRGARLVCLYVVVSNLVACFYILSKTHVVGESKGQQTVLQ